MRYIKTKYKFPLFFIAIMIVVISGFLNKFGIIGLLNTQIGVAIGFLLLVFAIAG